MLKIDYELLQQDLSFPLVIDEFGSYIWSEDKHGLQMVAQFEGDFRKQISTRMIPQEEFDIVTNTGIYKLKDGDFYQGEISDDNFIGLVRGWGSLQKKSNAERRQDNIANYLLNCLNIGI